MRSNCIIFATRLAARRLAKGRFGYIGRRPSLYRRGIKHWVWIEWRQDGRLLVIGFVPLAPTTGWFPPLLFEGRVERYDKAARAEHARRLAA